jgi:hypothetical protein
MAIYPADAPLTESRKEAIEGSMFTQDIINQVKLRFTAGSIRYPEKTIRAYLSVVMFKNGTVGKIQLKTTEDAARKCPKPRCKWYLIKAQ